ncbi:AraC family transcriptional regulator ligand-binding domain-containing protein [Mycobacterium sp. pUA109]|uniref:helix-turn-helix transcriptional regulator n=1 Tax=Mycobacterium sp. pUA109 TaxID=3238982 RepID=UPI00351BE085
MSTTAASWDFPRGVSGIRVLLEVARELGIPIADLLDGSDLSPSSLTDADTIVDAAQEMTVIRNLVRLGGDRPGLGVAAGRRLTVGMLGVWGFAMLLSPTVSDLLDIALRHGHGKLSWIFMRPTLVRRPGSARLELDASELSPAVYHFILERDLTSTATAIGRIVGQQLPLLLETSLPAERRQALRAALPQAVSVGGSHRNAFVFDTATLTRPLPMADPLTAEAVERQCVDLAVRRARHAGLAGRIRYALHRRPASAPTLADVAADRHVDPRTIRRQLSAEGTSFRALREEVRHRLALELLDTGELTVAQVSHRLGYSDPASFSRAFRRWTGHSPSAYLLRS